MVEKRGKKEKKKRKFFLNNGINEKQKAKKIIGIARKFTAIKPFLVIVTYL